MTDQDIMTRKEAAKYLRINIRLVDKLIANGELPSIKITPRAIRLRKSLVEQFVFSRETVTRP